jgi:predicted dehydrogenase/nucleoside-diphosphate-sugar epimerase
MIIWGLAGYARPRLVLNVRKAARPMSTRLIIQPFASGLEPKVSAPARPRLDASSKRDVGGQRVRNILLIGAGNIAAAHAEALKGERLARVAAVVDPNLGAASRLADAWGASLAYQSVDEALAAGVRPDAAHVLVPPDLHETVARPLLEMGCSVLIEKPMATSLAACQALETAAAKSGATLGVNQNFVFHPAFARLRRAVAAGAYGRARFVDCIYSMPLRQLAARQFGHWMFDAPGNILLEQAVHPLSQIASLAGHVERVSAVAGAPVELAPGVRLFKSVTASLTCASLPAQLHFAVGENFPVWQVRVVCDDGVLVADMLANSFYAQGRTRWLEVVDNLVSSGRTAGAIFREALGVAGGYGLSTLRLRPRGDSFFRSMKASIGAFHAALDAGAPPECDGAFGAGVVRACELIAESAFPEFVPSPTPPLAKKRVAVDRPVDVAVLGGTGFIGAETVRALLADGARVSVLARSIRNLPEVFGGDQVELHRGDIRDPEAVRRAIGDAPIVVNLAHGGGGASFEQVKAAMVGGAETVARACLAAGVKRLVHVSSIAALYLGHDAGVVTGATPPDPSPETRADYARAKAACERMLLDLHASEGLPVWLLRPGLVVGEGSSPFHSGLGLFNNDQHCVGWNAGRNPLPFVLVQDVAQAILLAMRASDGEGRCYNLVGDVRPNARAYVAALARATGRPLRFHPSQPAVILGQEYGKWLVKRAGGRRPAPPSRRDLLSRGLLASFDCDDAKRDLGWRPVADESEFLRLAIGAHA